MQSIKNSLFFMNQYNKRLVKKKWATLLLFLFPIFLIGLLLLLVAGLIIPDENEPIQVVLVNEDGTKESLLFSKILEKTATGNQFIQVASLPKESAELLLEENEISAYFLFPEDFIKDLYKGKSITVPIVGNPSQTMESYVVKELVESMTRLLATAQANILTINDYAKKVEMPEEKREEMLLHQFMDFTLYTLGKSKLLDEEVITNVATASPINYYILAGLFTLLSLWLLAFYSVTGKQEHNGMLIRMKLLGVSTWQRMIARIGVSLSWSLLLVAMVFIMIVQFINFDLYALDYFRFVCFLFLYAVLLLLSIAIIDVWITSRKVFLLLQSLLTFLAIFTSGAIIPTLYFPQTIQSVLPYLFSYESMNWMIDIVLEGRNYADFTKLIVFTSIGVLLLWLSTASKERWLS